MKRNDKSVAKKSKAQSAEFRDTEVITLVVVENYMSYRGESEHGAYIRDSYGNLFPNLIDQSQFNRRTTSLRYLIEAMR